MTATLTTESLVVGHSARMRAVFEFLRVISNSDSTVLITGESGTGKEVTATLIHQSSRRKHHPFVAVSCALFSETLIESELFGHERGAFTGAIKDRPGRFELADSGTIFLDDIDDVPLSMQVKLLRVLQNRTIERLGGTRTVPVNVRVIAGTKRDLKQMVAEGKFREDLYYRLNVLPVVLPPLRERREDIPVLMEHFLRAVFPQERRGRPAGVGRGVAGVHALQLARQRARAGERLRAHRADVHLRHGPHRVHVGVDSVPRRRRNPPTVVVAGADGAAAGVPIAARRSHPRAGIESDLVGAEREQRQQVAGRGAAPDQAVDAGRSHRALRAVGS